LLDARKARAVERHRRRRVLRIAFRCAGRAPRGEERNLVVAEARILFPRPLHLALARIERAPRRHRSIRRSRCHEPRDRLRVVVGQEREGGDVAGRVANLAVLLQDGLDVLVEGRPARRTASRRTGGLRLTRAAQENERGQNEAGVPYALAWTDGTRAMSKPI